MHTDFPSHGLESYQVRSNCCFYNYCRWIFDVNDL